jgi:hypothetical protein
MCVPHFTFKQLVLTDLQVIFTEPFKDNPNNRWNSPYLDDEVANIRKNQQLIAHVMELKEKFQTQNQALLHGMSIVRESRKALTPLLRRLAYWLGDGYGTGHQGDRSGVQHVRTDGF